MAERKRKSNPYLSRPQRLKLRQELADQGKNMVEIARILGEKPNAVYQWACANGLDIPTGSRTDKLKRAGLWTKYQQVKYNGYTAEEAYDIVMKEAEKNGKTV